MEKIFERELKTIKEKRPLIECLTNNVTINDVANAILAIGASPIMAHSVLELEDIIKNSGSVYINLGGICEESLKEMRFAAKMAEKYQKPLVLDAVGAGSSSIRNEFTDGFIKNKISIIHGNYSEIAYIVNKSSNSKGVDASVDESISMVDVAIKASQITNSVIVVTGKIDYVTDGKTCYSIDNGVAEMQLVTGCGCMLTGLLSAGAAATNNFLESALTITTLMSVAGERAKNGIRGLGDFHINLINELSTINYKILKEGAKIEKC
ncbi:hydroxyethylthiazole kinase [Peptoniphilus indolicus]|nr:hydroxyethylthiazole kinase [Peptoniphilus indolicus]SUB75170.1 Hydroxyethylthiazole kinase [Peptoniphilus indolicus]